MPHFITSANQVLNKSWFTPDSLLSIFTSLSKDLQQTPLGEYVRQSINQKDLLLLNKEMPTFSFKTNSGEHLNLSSFRDHNYVLICFWASWCGPCIRNIPVLRKLEETYRDKGLQVISISIDDSSSNWFLAIKKYPMPWLQTCDLPAYTNQRLRNLYEIHYVPQYFLLDKQGKLIYQSFLAKDNDDYNVLKETLQKTLNNKVM
jgi:peroxiredoxin